MIATILPILQQGDIRSVNSIWILAIVLILIFVMGLLGGRAKGDK